MKGTIEKIGSNTVRRRYRMDLSKHAATNPEVIAVDSKRESSSSVASQEILSMQIRLSGRWLFPWAYRSPRVAISFGLDSWGSFQPFRFWLAQRLGMELDY